MNRGPSVLGAVPEPREDAGRRYRRLHGWRMCGSRDACAVGAQALSHLVLLFGWPRVVVLAIHNYGRQVRRTGRNGKLVGAVDAAQQVPGDRDVVNWAGPERPLPQEGDDVIIRAVGTSLRFELIVP